MGLGWGIGTESNEKRRKLPKAMHSSLSTFWSVRCELAAFYSTTQVWAAPTITSSQTGSSSSEEYLIFPL